MPDQYSKLADFKVPYPQPEPDQNCCVLFLEEKPDEEENYRLQLIPGYATNDSAAPSTVSGVVREETIYGWGCNYYVVELGPRPTRRRSSQAFEKPTRFVPISSKHLLRYNSRLPVVVYLPKGVELRYRVWSPIDVESVNLVESGGSPKSKDNCV
ncbi:unnamed protein product [Trypanosoma congolense IL3000]|uniref:WGS project CAEQ00000000 data, annotated contig 1021 n=1 Tax=Trypanosoma congolense (strain IL3000) TaxID=1068625 RepID=F9W391_TRYCI|nr:unnamed protein product [Trypanosoma congolense IL3000]CCD15820.1 unnamed protein product [Trypanosoma congolense IL3000]